MNRREALATLLALPTLERVSVARLNPQDVIVVEATEELSDVETAQMTAHLSHIWPGHKIVVCDRGTRLKVIASDPPQEPT